MKKYGVDFLQGVLVLFFIVPGFMKMTGSAELAEAFVRFGYPLWFMYFIGAAEVAGALGIAFGSFVNKKLPQLAVLGLIIIMIGALGSHVEAGDQIPGSLLGIVIMLGIYLYILRKNSRNSVL